jgi:hypothetical protein
MNSPMAWPYDSCELAAPSGVKNRNLRLLGVGESSIVLALDRFDVFLCAIPDGLLRRTSMVVEVEAYGLQVRLWIVSE